MSAGADNEGRGRESTPERRAYRRVRGPFDAERMGLLEFRLRLIDLSAGGCFVDSRTEVSAEHPIRLRIALPDGNSVTIRGRVTMPARDVGYGVRFVDVDESTRQIIEHALESA